MQASIRVSGSGVKPVPIRGSELEALHTAPPTHAQKSAERNAVLCALEEAPTDALGELRGALLRDHESRRRNGLVDNESARGMLVPLGPTLSSFRTLPVRAPVLTASDRLRSPSWKPG